ncbi:hypothetical protein DsansV1_C29g0212741 [Dioscorea sansibarensis]
MTYPMIDDLQNNITQAHLLACFSKGLNHHGPGLQIQAVVQAGEIDGGKTSEFCRLDRWHPLGGAPFGCA